MATYMVKYTVVLYWLYDDRLKNNTRFSKSRDPTFWFETIPFNGDIQVFGGLTTLATLEHLSSLCFNIGIVLWVRDTSIFWYGRGCAWQRGVRGRGRAWRGACVAGGGCAAGLRIHLAGGRHPTGIHSCGVSSSWVMKDCDLIKDISARSIWHFCAVGYFRKTRLQGCIVNCEGVSQLLMRFRLTGQRPNKQNLCTPYRVYSIFFTTEKSVRFDRYRM